MKPLKDYSFIKGFNYGLERIDKSSHEIEVRQYGLCKTADIE